MKKINIDKKPSTFTYDGIVYEHLPTFGDIEKTALQERNAGNKTILLITPDKIEWLFVAYK